MDVSACIILYTAMYIQQNLGALRFSVKLYDLCRTNWKVDQWFHTSVFFYYTGLFTTTKSQNSLTKFSAIWDLFDCCEYLQEWWCNIWHDALSNHVAFHFEVIHRHPVTNLSQTIFNPAHTSCFVLPISIDETYVHLSVVGIQLKTQVMTMNNIPHWASIKHEQ